MGERFGEDDRFADWFGVGFVADVDVGEGVTVAKVVFGPACEFGSVRKGMKVTLPKLKSFLKS